MIIALIPARSGSKGVPNKNIRNLCGHTLLEWSIQACKQCNLIDEIYVSTDSKEYREMSINYGAKAPFLRPENISSDLSTDYEFFIHALDWFKNNLKEPEYIAHIRPTTPLRNPKLIDKAIDTFVKSKKGTALRSVHEMSESAYKNFEIAEKGNLQTIFSKNSDLDESNNARQSFPKTYIANGYIDVISSTYLRKNNLLHGNYVLPFVTPISFEIDEEADFDLLEYKINKNPALKELIFN